MATRCKPSIKLAEGVKPTTAVSRINVAISGVFLDTVYQRMQNPTNHAIQNHACWQGGIFASRTLESLSSLTDHACWQGGIFASRTLESLSSLTGQQMMCRPPRLLGVARLAFLTANFTNLTFFRDSWGQKFFWLILFNIWLCLKVVGTCYQTCFSTF